MFMQPESDLLSSLDTDIPERQDGVSMQAAARRLMITPQQATNLFTLGQHLRAAPQDYQHFDMETYFSWAPGDEPPTDNPVAEKNILRPGHPRYSECGTTACALGHGPAATGETRQLLESWPHYGARLTGLNFAMFGHTYEGAKDFPALWCFGGGWSALDNTPRSAGARIIALLDDFMLADPLVRAEVLDVNRTEWDVLNYSGEDAQLLFEEEEWFWDKVQMLYAPYQTRAVRQLP